MKLDERWADAVVDSVQPLSPTVRGLRLRPAQGVQPWTLGSHVRVQVQVDGREEVRSYSLVGLPQDSLAAGCWQIAVKRAEPGRGGSRAMWQLQPGDRLRVAGPDNHFGLAPATAGAAHRPVLLVAGGIGITPLLGMAQFLAAQGAPVRLCYAVREPAELVWVDTLRSALGDRLSTHVSSLGQRLDLEREVAALPAGAQLWICGPASMLQAAQAAWRAAGRPAAHLRFETFGSSGTQAAQAFWVRVPRQGLAFEVPAGRSLLDVLNEQGVDTLADCRRGECGLCAVDVLELEGRIDHRDVFLSGPERQDNRRLCACVSRVCGGGIVIDSAWRPDPPRPAPAHR